MFLLHGSKLNYVIIIIMIINLKWVSHVNIDCAKLLQQGKDCSFVILLSGYEFVMKVIQSIEKLA